MLNRAGDPGAAPPGCVALRVAAGFRYVPALASQSPTPASMRTVEVPGFQAACGTRTSNCRRVVSTVTVGAGETGAPVVASVSVAVVPCTVRNRCAGELTPAASGHGCGTAESPNATVNATLLGSFSVLRVTRNAVWSASGFTRSSTRSAALFA